MIQFTLVNFVRESNRIERILRDPSARELAAHKRLLALDRITVGDLVAFVNDVQPDAVLRDRPGLDVYVGDHVPPPGSQEIPHALDNILADIADPFEAHVAYETLHPFTDGNGRSGRAFWLHRMGGIERAPLGFLHHFYYQTLSHSRYDLK